MKRGGDLHPARPDWWPPIKRPRATPGRLIAASPTVCHGGRVGPSACARPLLLGGTIGVHQTSWCIPFPRHACMFLVLGFRGAWVSHALPRVPNSAGLRMQLYPRSADLVWPGHLHGTGCLSARAMDTGFPTVAWLLCFGLGSARARVSASPRHSWLGCWGVCALVCALRLYPATPGWGVGVCVCLCAPYACTPPLLARVCGVGLCASAQVSAAPRHSWLGCWAVCVPVCLFCLYPATPGWDVRCGCACFGLGFGCAPPLLAGLLQCVCVRVRAPLVPRHSWPGFAASVCVLGLAFRLRHTIPGWSFGVCVCALRLYPATPGWVVWCGSVCSGSGFGCAPPLPAEVSGCVCACVRAPLVPRHSWLKCAVWVCVHGLGVRLLPVSPGWGAGVCVFVCLLHLYPAIPAWGVGRGCVCFGSGFCRAPPLLARVLGCVCVCVRAPLVPRHPWLGCAALSGALGLRLRLCPATPGCSVGLCVYALRL